VNSDRFTFKDPTVYDLNTGLKKNVLSAGSKINGKTILVKFSRYNPHVGVK